ncbi:MAG: hypothetical protein F6K16_28330 [Symploca sp. SIO2B6]|nr:hypothetical protein [Symploca sp. SIO2B6]
MASEITYHPSEAEIWEALQELKLKETATSSQQGQFELKLEDFCEHIRTLLPRSLWRLNAWCFLLEMEMYLRG